MTVVLFFLVSSQVDLKRKGKENEKEKTLLAVLLSALVLVGALVTLNTSSVELEAKAYFGTLGYIYVVGEGWVDTCTGDACNCVVVYGRI